MGTIQISCTLSPRDRIVAASILDWVQQRTSKRSAWKKVSSLATAFGFRRLTQVRRQRITAALLEVGLVLEPSLEALSTQDTVRLHQVNGMMVGGDDSAPTLSDRLPSQIITWDATNMGDADGAGEWLRCLKATVAGDRQFIWEGSSPRGIVGVVTYAGPMRNLGVHEGWGQFESFPGPVSRDRLLACPATAYRFGNPGIRALQGTAIRLTETEAEAIVSLLGGLSPTEIPWEEPDGSNQAIPWVRSNGLPAEKFAEDEIHRNQRIWRRLGLARQPLQQVTWPEVGRVDLVCGNTVIEVKKAVTLTNGPAQLERYLGYLAKKLGVGPDGVRGILVQKHPWASPALQERLAASDYHLELWSLDQNSEKEWQVEWVFGS